MIVGAVAKHDDLRGQTVSFEAELLLQRQKSMLQRTFSLNALVFKSINELSHLTLRRFNGEIKIAKALWKSL